MKNALIVYGGWEGHEPKPVSEVFKKILTDEGFRVEMSDRLEAFDDAGRLLEFDLIVPVWTMGKIDDGLVKNVCDAVRSGAGIAGCHGGMCDAFRENTDWQFMTGSQWVAHPGDNGVEYAVHILKSGSSPITEGLNDFKVKSEQYYLHVDPAIDVLATTDYPTADGPHASNGHIVMPVVYTKRWGKGKVFYNSLGHGADIFDIPEARELMRRGFLWASR